jgi:hypothetical protein
VKVLKVPGIFRVDGVTKFNCEKMASKKLSIWLIHGRELTPEEYEDKHSELASELFAGIKPKAVSKEFSTPSLANEYKELLKRTTPPSDYRDLRIMINLPSQSKDGGIKKNTKTLKVVMSWRQFDDSINYEKIVQEMKPAKVA